MKMKISSILHLLALVAVAAAETSIGKQSAELKRAAVKTTAPAIAKAAVEPDSGKANKEQESEYVHIKPEEVGNAESSDKSEQLALAENQDGSQQPQKASAADEQLQAHLSSGAGDTISELESSYQPYAEMAPAAAGQQQAPSLAPRVAIAGGGYPPQRPREEPYAAPTPPKQPAHQRQPPRRPVAHRQPPSYTTMKGKLTGINSVVSQYPHPAPGYPHQVPRHLPRGAAAGYAAFRDFVRAHASKYKQQAQQQQQQHQPMMGTQYPPSKPPPPPPSYSPRPTQLAKTTKLSVAQAYIPHAGAYAQPQEQQQQQQTYAPNSMLAKLYGNHLPKGQGRPEYSKDYGMVIHYPQATVYTEPMTVDQLHKLTGAGISQVLAQLQQQLAGGHRDESNTIRPNSAHHLGHGLSIQAKEFMAPGKHGQYVPTTAAVITHQQDQSGQQDSTGLGSGYERVRQAVAASQANYKAAGYSSPAESGEQPLSAITSLIGGELESLYKANAAFTKQLDPVDLHSQLQNYAGSKAAKTPLSYQELQGPLALYGADQPQHQQQPSQRYRQQGARGPGRPPRGNRRRPRPNRYQNQQQQPQPQMQRPYGGAQQQQPQRLYGRPQSVYGGGQQPYNGGQHQRPNQQMAQPRPQQAYQQQQQPAYQQANMAAEQALQQQMQQLMQDFQAGDDQYNGRQPAGRPASQGYPHKVMQKYQQQQQQQSAYGQHEGLEIPQGPNDQIGEIADLIEALKSSLEQHKPEQQPSSDYGNPPKQHLAEDVRYLAGALGQTPSYAMQVPVAQEAPQSYQQQQQQQQSYQPSNQQQPSYQSSQQQPSSYQQQSTYGAYQQQQQQPQMQQQQQQDYSQQQDQQQQSYQQQQQSTYQSASQPQAGNILAGTYPTAPAPALAPAGAEPSQYSSHEHSQIINHLVPVADQQQPASQIALAAPTDSHYQQAQSLSSFVDSLPGDYQELLRQPQLDHSHLAIQAPQQETQVGAYSTLTTNVTHLAAPVSSSSSAASSAASSPASPSVAAAAASSSASISATALSSASTSTSTASNSSLAQSYQQAAQQASQAQPSDHYTPQQQQSAGGQ